LKERLTLFALNFEIFRFCQFYVKFTIDEEKKPTEQSHPIGYINERTWVSYMWHLILAADFKVEVKGRKILKRTNRRLF
jgi:hypothetical protein